MLKEKVTTKYTHIPESIREDMIKLRIKTRCNKDKNILIAYLLVHLI